MVQVERDVLKQPAELADLRKRPLEKPLVVGLEPQIALLGKDFVIYFQISAPGQAALALAVGWPRVGKIQINAVDLAGREHLAQLGGVKRHKAQIGQRMLLAPLGRHDQRALLPLDRDEIDIRMLLCHADGKPALAAADFQMQRMVVAEQRAPAAALLLWPKRHHIRAGGKAHVQIFLFAHSHA